CQDLAGAMNVADGAFSEAASALTTFANTCESIERQLRDISGKLDSPPAEAVAIGRPGGLAGYDSTLRMQAANLKIEFQKAEHTAATAFCAFQMSAPTVGKPLPMVAEPGVEATNDIVNAAALIGGIWAVGRAALRIAGRGAVEGVEDAVGASSAEDEA